MQAWRVVSHGAAPGNCRVVAPLAAGAGVSNAAATTAATSDAAPRTRPVPVDLIGPPSPCRSTPASVRRRLCPPGDPGATGGPPVGTGAALGVTGRRRAP